MASTTTIEGLNNFGNWMKTTRLNRAKWPDALEKWFKENYEATGQLRLTQEILGEWLAEISGNKDENYGYRVKTIEWWANIDSFKSSRTKGIKFDLIFPLGMSGFLSLSGYPVDFDSLWIFDEVLKGNINPLNDQWPTHPVGRGLGKKLGTYLQGIVRGSADKSLADLVTRAEFVAGEYTEKDISTGGFFLNLIEGKVYNVDLYDLELCSRCVSNWLKKHGVRSSDFTLEDLLSTLRGEIKDMDLLREILPDSVIGVMVHYHCADHDINVNELVRQMGISKERWNAIEKGAEPTSEEYKEISSAIGESVAHLKMGWSGQYQTSAQKIQLPHQNK